MSVSNIISLCGGLGMFLFGMKYMGDGLSLAAGARMKDLLEKLTRKPVLGFLMGVLVTMVIQSSSATTVMSMGFINAGIMDLAQATGVILGANIGTTVTSVLIALDASAIAPFCIFVGAFLMLYGKKKTQRHVGQVILGFGLLFMGLRTMSSSMSPLKNVPWFQNFVMNAKNPFVGLIVGIIFCAVIQSSSAAVGVLQAMAMQGMMPLYFAGFLIAGINIGSSTPVIISSMGARNNTKRAAMVYLLHNIVGALIFVPLTLLTPYTQLLQQYIPDPVFQISFYHIVFKVVPGLVLLPLTKQLVNMTYRIIPKQSHEDELRLEFIDENLVTTSNATIAQIHSEVERMTKLVRENLVLSTAAMLNNDLSQAKTIEENERKIDFLNNGISAYLVKINVMEMNEQEAQYVARVYQALNDLERIGDYAEILLSLTEKNVDQSFVYSDKAKAELAEIVENDLMLFDASVADFMAQHTKDEELRQLAKMQRKISDQAAQSQVNHLRRMRAEECAAAPGVGFVEVLNCLDRIGGHSINVAEASLASKNF